MSVPVLTESQWLTFENLRWMIPFLRYRASDRKLRLFSIACYRHVVPVTKRKLVRLAVEASEKYADRLILLKELNQRRVAAASRGVHTNEDFAALAACRKPISASHVASCSLDVVGDWYLQERERAQEELYQTRLLRCVFGNPFRPPVIEANVLTWNDGTVPKIAQAVYVNHTFEDLPILADALEDGGFTDDAGILDHLRSGGPHCRGCHVVDLLLDKK